MAEPISCSKRYVTADWMNERFGSLARYPGGFVEAALSVAQLCSFRRLFFREKKIFNSIRCKGSSLKVER
jgi:hypothetical protein